MNDLLTVMFNFSIFLYFFEFFFTVFDSSFDFFFFYVGLFRSRFLNNGYFLFFDFVLLGCLDLESFGFFFVMLVWQEIEGLMNLVNVVFWIKGEILVLFVCELCCIVVAYW